ncbi:MAG: DUF4340 domain-containing protein [Chloroflexi bacterium]|nr:DUF4340 domain-containing protein [Chloroflexota bacterium]
MRLRNILILLVVFLALAGYFYFSNRGQPVSTPEPKLYVWLIDMDNIQRIEIKLPLENESQSFIKEVDRSWHFDDAERSSVNMTRWGGGIPLLLSGPAANRIITENATEAELTKFGLTQPRMKITLTLTDGTVLNITVGDSTPDGMNYYVQTPGSNDVATVDFTWFDVLAGLVRDPPYALPPKK